MSSHRVHVVTVDDDPGIRRLIAAVLDRAGFVVEIAASADDVLALINSHPDDVHVLLTETAMPGLDGLGLAAQVCRAAPDLATVFLTDWADPATPLGFVLRKPFSPSALVAIVEEAVAGCRKPPRRERPQEPGAAAQSA